MTPLPPSPTNWTSIHLTLTHPSTAMLQTLQDLYKCLPLHYCKSFTFSGKCSAAVVLIEHKSVTFIILDCTMFPPPWQYTILALGWHTSFCENVENLPINPAQSCQTLKPSWLSSCTVFETKLRSKYETRIQSNKKFISDNLVQKCVSYTQIWNQRLGSMASKRAGGSQWADVFCGKGGIGWGLTMC